MRHNMRVLSKVRFGWSVAGAGAVFLGLGAAWCLFGQGPGPRRVENPQDFSLPGGSRVEFRSFAAPSIGHDAHCSVFLPPHYGEGDRNYPVVLFLHGLWNDHTSWTMERYGNLPATLERLMVEGTIPECLLVHPDGENGFYTDYLDGSRRYEQELLADLVAFVSHEYRVGEGREWWSVGGVSMGGYGALKLALKYPDRFAAAAAVSPIVLRAATLERLLTNQESRFAQFLSGVLRPVFGFPIDEEHWRANDLFSLAERAENAPPILIVYGTGDRYNGFLPLEDGIHELVERLRSRGIACTYVEDPGGPHGWELVTAHLDEVARFLTAPFRRLPAEAAARPVE
ncbi:MAG: hypothetical protein Kow00109_05340 [Acidobacteriota bacterium]